MLLSGNCYFRGGGGVGLLSGITGKVQKLTLLLGGATFKTLLHATESGWISGHVGLLCVTVPSAAVPFG